MSEHTEILLIEPRRDWAERFISELAERDWSVTWSEDAQAISQDRLYQVYLINLSTPNLDPTEVCQSIRTYPKGENASIFLLNDGSAELRSFEDALSVKADGLYFHHAQLSLILTNFPAKSHLTPPVRSPDSHNTLSQNTHSRSIVSNPSSLSRPNGVSDASPVPEQPTLHNRERVLGMSLGHRNRQRLSLGYSTDQGLSVADIEAELARISINESPQPAPSQVKGLEEVSQNEAHEGLPRHHHSREEHSGDRSLVPSVTPGGSSLQESPSSSRVSSYPSPEPSLIRDPAVYDEEARDSNLWIESPSQEEREPLLSQIKTGDSVNLGNDLGRPSYTPRPASQYLNPASPIVNPMTSNEQYSLEAYKLSPLTSALSHQALQDLPWGERADLSDHSFANCFAHIIVHRLSLNIRIEESGEGSADGRWWSISFSEGELVGLETSYLDERLAQRLVVERLLSPIEAERLLSEVSARVSTGRLEQFIDLTVELNPDTIASLEELVNMTIYREFLCLFELTSGALISSAFRRPSEIVRLRRPATRLLIDGVQSAYGRLRLYSQFTTLKAIPLVERAELFMTYATTEERALLERAQGDKTVAELAEECDLNPTHALGFCYALSLLNKLEVIEKSPLKDFYHRAISEDYFQLLGIGYEARDIEAVEEWQRCRQWLATQRGDPEMIQAVINILNDAYCVLVHAPLRVRYLKSLSKPIYSEMSIIPQPGEVVSLTRHL